MVDAVDRPVDLERLDVVVADELVLRVAFEVGDVLALPGDEVVDADHLVPLSQEQVGEVRAKEPGAAGNEDTHKT